MINWLIHKLGGFTAWEVEKAELSASDLVSQIEKQSDFLMEQIREKDKEIARLSNLIFLRAGFIVPEGKDQETKEPPQPINHRLPWRARQKELEKEDAKRAADDVERRWKNKPGAVPIGDGDHENVPNGTTQSIG